MTSISKTKDAEQTPLQTADTPTETPAQAAGGTHAAWRAKQSEQFEYPSLANTHIVPRHLENIWNAIDRNDDVALNKALVQPGAIERSELVTTPRTQRWSNGEEMQMTPLMAAVAIGSSQLVETLLRQGGPAVRTALASKAGAAYTADAMMVAAKYGHVDIMSILVENRFGSATALKVIETQSPEAATVTWLRAQGTTSEQLHGAFEQAFDRGDLKGLKVLVKIGGLDLVRRRVGFVAKAIAQGRFDVAQKLIELGAPINALIGFWAQFEDKYVGYSPLALAILHRRIRNDKRKEPKPFEYWIAKTAASEAPAEGRHAFISFLVNSGARVNDVMLTHLIEQGDFAIYADISKTETYWPKSSSVIKRLGNLVDRDKHPMVSLMLECQRFVIEDDANLKKGAGPALDKAEESRATNFKDFQEACEIVMDGTSSIGLAGNTRLALQNDAHVAKEVKEGGLSGLAKGAMNKLGLDKLAEARGRELVLVDKKAAKNKGKKSFSLFKRK